MHFSVIVNVGKVNESNVLIETETLLQPYHQFECTGIDDEYIEDIDVTEEYEESYAENGKGESFLEWFTDFEGIRETDVAKPGHTCGNMYIGLTQIEDGKYKVVRRTNPNDKWDWWEIGGRWSDFFLLNSGEKSNYARKRDIDFHGAARKNRWNQELDYYNVRFNILGYLDTFIKLNVSHNEKERDAYMNQPAILWARKNGIDVYSFDDYTLSLEEFLEKRTKSFGVPFALVEKDGVWNDKDEYDGDWYLKFKKFLDDSDDDDILVIVDCHM